MTVHRVVKSLKQECQCRKQKLERQKIRIQVHQFVNCHQKANILHPWNIKNQLKNTKGLVVVPDLHLLTTPNHLVIILLVVLGPLVVVQDLLVVVLVLILVLVLDPTLLDTRSLHTINQILVVAPDHPNSPEIAITQDLAQDLPTTNMTIITKIRIR